MNEKKNWKQRIKDWWKDNKKTVKVGLVCGLVGIVYGFIKGVTTTVFNVTVTNSDSTEDDDFEYTEDNVDDPELLELIRSGKIDS